MNVDISSILNYTECKHTAKFLHKLVCTHTVINLFSYLV